MKPNPFDLVKGLFKKENPFRELSPSEKQKQRESEQAVKEGIKKLGILCADILHDQRYKEFADVFRDIESRIIDLLIDCDEEDRDKYFLKISTLQIKLRMFRQILKMPRQFCERAEEIKKIERRMVK